MEDPTYCEYQIILRASKGPLLVIFLFPLAPSRLYVCTLTSSDFFPHPSSSVEAQTRSQSNYLELLDGGGSIVKSFVPGSGAMELQLHGTSSCVCYLIHSSDNVLDIPNI